MSKFCVSCGKQLDDDATFCNGCGAKQGEAAAPAQQAAPAPAPAPVPPQPDAAASLNGDFAMFSENPTSAVKVDKIINDKVDPFIVKRGLVVAIVFLIFMQLSYFWGYNVRMAHFDDNEALWGESDNETERKAKDLAQKLALYSIDGDDLDYENISLNSLINKDDEKGNAMNYISAMMDLEEETHPGGVNAKKGVSGLPATIGAGLYILVIIPIAILALVILIQIIKIIKNYASNNMFAAWKCACSASFMVIIIKVLQNVGAIAMKLGTDKVAKNLYDSMGKDESEAYHLVKLSPFPIIGLVLAIAFFIIAKKARTHFYQVEMNARAAAPAPAPFPQQPQSM